MIFAKKTRTNCLNRALSLNKGTSNLWLISKTLLNLKEILKTLNH